MILVPLSPRGEISFLLDRNKVATTGERIAVDNAAYRGQDNQGRDFVVTAGTAVQRSPEIPIVEMQKLIARMNLRDGPADIAAPLVPTISTMTPWRWTARSTSSRPTAIR